MKNLSFGIDKSNNVILDGENIFRYISKKKSDEILEFLKKTVNGSRLKTEFIYSELNNEYKNDLQYKINHRKIPFITYPYEWTPSMLKDAALYFLDLINELKGYGFTLKDGHPWNILFENGKPIWVDLGSIQKINNNIPRDTGLDDFKTYFINPLILYSSGFDAYARLSLSILYGMPDFPFQNELKKSVYNEAKKSFKNGINCLIQKLNAYIKTRLIGAPTFLASRDLCSSVDNIRKLIINLEVTPSRGQWSNYYKGQNQLPVFDPITSSISDVENSTTKHSFICNILSGIKNSKVLDIGCNSGLYSIIAEKYGNHVMSVDSDELATDCLYKASNIHKKNINVICQDFIAPLEPSENYIRKCLLPLHVRCKSDVVLCLAVIHHWVFKKYKLTFPEIAELFSFLTKNLLIVEFIDRKDKNVSRWLDESYDWYNLNNLKQNLAVYFSDISTHDSFPEGRKLLLCKK